MAGLKDDTPAALPADDDASYDLLDGLTEDNGTPWVPDDRDDPSPEGIQGRVSFVGTVPSDFPPPADVPLLEIDDGDTTWSVRGYATVLRNQIEKADPQVGDLIAIRYFGMKSGKGDREYKNFKVAVKRA